MGRVEKKTFVTKDQGVVCAFICPLAVKHRRRMLNNTFYRRLSWVVLFIALTAILCSGLSTYAAPGPQPPCGTAAFPLYPDLEKSPVVRVWDGAELGRDWTPPACTGWTYSGSTTVLVTVARFRHTSGVDGLLRRVGAIS